MRKRRSTVRPKWHLHGGASDPKNETNDAGDAIVIIIKKRKIGDHAEAWGKNKPYSRQAYRAIRRATKMALKKHDCHEDYAEVEYNMPHIRSEHNWRGT